MGFPYHELIAPAILLDNPGLTKDQFINHFQNTHFYEFFEPERSDPWDKFPPREDLRSDRLPRILNLPYSQAFIDFQASTTDSLGLILNAPILNTNYKDSKLEFEVISHIENKLGPTKLIKSKFRENIKEGKSLSIEDESSYYQDPTYTNYIVDKIFEKKYLKRRYFSYTLEAREINLIAKREIFNSEEELFQKWPQYKPENIYDFSQTNGYFSVLMGEEKFLWKNINGRFYLDEETFNRISAGFSNTRTFGYTDLILTREAIRHQAWKLLSYRGLDHLDDFLKDFPESKVEYDKAVWDSHTSLYAKDKGMNHFEMIRERLLSKQICEEKF